MLKVANIFFEIYYAAFQGFCLQYFLGSFLEDRGRKKYKNGFLIVVLYTVFILCAGRLLSGGHEDMKVIGNQLAIFAVLVLLALLFYKSIRAITGYLIITFMAVSQISFFISHSILKAGSEIYGLWTWCIEKGYITDERMVAVILNITTIGLQILMCGVFSILCFHALKNIAHSFCEKDYAVNRTELCFLLAPSTVGLLVCILLRIIVVTVEHGMPRLLYSNHPLLIMVVPAILVLCLLSVIYSVKLFQDMILLNREKNSKAILEKQISSMQGQIAEMEHIYSGIRGMKHDMGTTIAIIMQLVERNGENADLRGYLSELNQTFDKLELRYKTGNAVIDTLLSMKYHELMRIMPEVKLYADKLLFPENLMIQSYDLGVIIGNALDNAIEACKKMEGCGIVPFIRISSFLKGRMFFIKVENSFDGKVVRKKGAEFPATTKPDPKAHGIGLDNMKSIAGKYHGAVDWQVENGVFTLTIMLKNERSTENEYR